MPLGDIAPEIAVVVTAIVALLFAVFMRHDRQWLCAPLALAGIAIAAALCAFQAGQSRLTFSGIWAIDGASVWARLLVLGATGFTVLLTPAWLRRDRRHGEYYTVLLLSALGAMVMAAAANLVQLVVGVMLSSVTGYTIAAYHRDWPLSVEAGMKYFLVGAFANALLVVGVTVMFGLLGNPGFMAIAQALSEGGTSPLLVLGATLVIVGLAFKMAAVPAHSWMPDVAEGAPVPSAAFLTVVPKVGATVALMRVVSLFPPEATGVQPTIAVLSVATMTLGNFAALWQDDVRRLIGWSSVSQSGYALMAVCVAGIAASAVPALLLFLLGYTAANLTAFAVVAHLRGRTARQQFDGLARLRPWPAIALIVSFLSLVGIPPLAGFIGKLALFMATIDAGYGWLAAVAIGNTVISLFYYLRVIAPMCFGDAGRRPQVLSRGSALAVWLGLGLVIGLGVLADVTIDAFAGSAVAVETIR